MDGTTQPSDRTEVASAEANQPSPQLLSGTKRTVSETAGSPTDQGEDAMPPSPKRRKGSDASKHTESRDSPSPGEQSPAGAPPKAHGGWNQGVSGGLRTSFGSSSKVKRPAKRSSQPVAESIDVSSLVMPSGNANAPKPSQKDEWQSVFVRWCVRLMALNKGHDELKDATLLGEAWRVWLRTQTPFSRAQQSAAVRAGKEASLDNDKVQEMFSEAATADTAQPWNGSPAAETSQADSPLSEGQIRDGAQSSASSRPQSRAGQETNGWVLPPPLSPSDFEANQKDRHAWEGKFLDWCKSLVRLNDGNIKAETGKERNRVTETYLRWIGGIDKLSKAKAATARRAAVHYAQENGPQLAAIFSAEVQAADSAPLPEGDAAPLAATATPAGPDNDNATVDSPDGPVGGIDAETYRETYFPGTGQAQGEDANASPFCHACATRGHDASACPQLACHFCQDDEPATATHHRAFSCPRRRRCAKCKQLGHARRDCAEKLALPPGEVECSFCGARGEHADAECHEVWRSFVINVTEENAVRKVRALPVYCYTCGREGHYGPECGLNPQRTKVGEWETWCRANRERYTDKEATEVAIVYQGQDQSQGSAAAPERPDLGKSIVPRRHIFFEESDDDEEEYDWFAARPGTQGGNPGGRRPSRQDNKTHNSNYGGGNGNGNGNGASGFTQQPPLPPGPPPPLPPPPQPRRYHQERRRNGGRRRGGWGGGGGGADYVPSRDDDW